MLKNFTYWKKLHDSDTLFEFNSNKQGLLWLKIKSITRKSIITEFAKKFSYTLQERTLTKQFVELFDILNQNIDQSHKDLDDYINLKNIETLDELDTESLVNELYKLKIFDWGGDYQNALDKYLVSKYVKANNSYDWLVSKLETEIA